MEHDLMVRLIQQTLVAAMDGDTERAATTIQQLGDGTDAAGMYTVCRAFGMAAKHALEMLYGQQPKDAQWFLRAVHPGVFDKDPAQTFSARFIVAYANDDTDTCLALYRAATHASDEQYVDSVLALLKDTAMLLKLAEEEKNAGRLPT